MCYQMSHAGSCQISSTTLKTLINEITVSSQDNFMGQFIQIFNAEGLGNALSNCTLLETVANVFVVVPSQNMWPIFQ